MDTHSTPIPHRPSRETQIRVLPARMGYADQMESCHQAAYGYSAAEVDEPECLTAEHFRQHLQVFPEGQFMALDTATDLVVGTTSNMRLNFNLRQQNPRSWAEITSDG